MLCVILALATGPAWHAHYIGQITAYLHTLQCNMAQLALDW